MDSKEVHTGRVDARNDKVGANMAMIAEEVLLKEGHTGYHARLAAGRERVEFELGGDYCRGELGTAVD